jgi:hypothetical protein
MELYPQAVWLAHQAVEKYLKSILLFRIMPANKYGHNLIQLYQSIQNDTRFPMHLPELVIKDLENLDTFGTNRYRERFLSCSQFPVYVIDRIIWHLRWYSQYVGCTLGTYDDFNDSNFQLKRESITQNVGKIETVDHQIQGGKLEKILKVQGTKIRGTLIWKNLFFGSKKRKIVRIKHDYRMENSVQVIWQHESKLLLKYIQFPNDISKWLKSLPNEKLK